jgi:hypothetical protein
MDRSCGRANKGSRIVEKSKIASTAVYAQARSVAIDIDEFFRDREVQ